MCYPAVPNSTMAKCSLLFSVHSPVIPGQSKIEQHTNKDSHVCRRFCNPTDLHERPHIQNFVGEIRL